MLKRYPFDPTGQSATNLVRNETHTLDTLTDVRKPRIVFTRLGAFFNDSLVVTHNGKKLTLNTDYRYTFFWQEATMKAGGLPVSVAFQIINKRLTGDIEITYQVVGGEFQEKAIQLEELIKLLPFDARNVFWDDVINKPVAYEPVRHLHHINDVFGLSRLLGVLGELRRSLEGQSVLKLKSVYDRFLKLKQYVDANMVDLENINTRVETLEEAKTNHEGRIVALEGEPAGQSQLEGKPAEQSQLDDEEIKRLVSARLNEIIVDKRNELSDPMLSIPNLIVYPDEEGGVTYGENETNRVYPVQSMDPAITHNELQRSVFTPATVFEFTKTTTWTVPDIYDKLVAQVFVTAGVRGKTLPDGNLLIHPPSTDMRYIKLKGGTNVPITVGSISSFGAFVTNDGSLEQKGLIQPTYPIVMKTNNLVNEDENIRQYYGKLGKVVIVV